MGILKKRAVATVIAVICSLASLFGGVSMSLNRQCKKVENGFYDGVVYDGYRHPSIADQLSDRCDASLGLISVLDDSIDAELKAARDELMDAETISEKCTANDKLQKAYEKVKPKIGDSKAEKAYISTMDATQKLIEESGYNDSVCLYEKNVLNAFPISLLKNLVNAKRPEGFGLRYELGQK